MAKDQKIKIILNDKEKTSLKLLIDQLLENIQIFDSDNIIDLSDKIEENIDNKNISVITDDLKNAADNFDDDLLLDCISRLEKLIEPPQANFKGDR